MPMRARNATLGAVACVTLLALMWFAAFHLGFFRHLDQSIYLQFVDLKAHGRIASIAEHFVRLFDVNPYAYLVLAPLVLALLRRRPCVVLAVAAIVLGANVTTEVLKHVLAAPRPGSLFAGGVSSLPPASWPSGHSTAVMALVLASVLAAPARLRPVVAALGASLGIAVGYSLLATGTHYPSDVLGGFLVAATWALCAVAALLASERWRSSPRRSHDRVSIRSALGAPGAVVVAALVFSLVLVGVRTHEVVSYVQAHRGFVLGAAGIAVLSLSLSTAVVLSVRR
ncbi:MAG: phosphatase PAP2 family protein [Solirubrobacterales bacterium]|nr:phosphatase PAP2 family protein [Solirubrobacterales bacterium]